jgi:hypothetical protein
MEMADWSSGTGERKQKVDLLRADFSSIISANLCIYGELLTLGAYDWCDEGSSNLLNANFLWRKRRLMYS